MTIVKFGDVAQKVLGNEDRLSTTREYYIGGEHFATGNLEIKQFGRIRDEDLGYQFHFPFESGDVLFMTKNPRLKKAGRVNISGICSIATFVIRTKSESRLLQDFLPIIMQSDSFWEYLMANQSGSVNPFIKWGTLEKYCFDLPDISTQKQYCTIIWNLQELINELETQTALLDQLVKSRFIELFGDLDSNSKHWVMKTIGDVAKVPLHYGSTASAIDYDEEVRYVRITDIGPDGKLNDDFKSPSTYDSSYLLNKGDVLFARSGSVGVTYYFDESYKSIFAGYLIRFIPDDKKINPEFAYQFTRSAYCQGILVGSKRGGVQKNVNAKQLSAIPIPLPPMELQNEFIEFVHQVDKSKVGILSTILLINNYTITGLWYDG